MSNVDALKKFLYQHKLSYLLSSSELNTLTISNKKSDIKTMFPKPLLKKEEFLFKSSISSSSSIPSITEFDSKWVMTEE